VAARTFHTVELDVRQEEEPMAAILRALEGERFEDAIVRVAITLDSAQSLALREREIEAALEGAASVSVVREVEVESRVRLGEFAPETLTPRQLLEKYFESRAVDPERREVLLTRAEDIIADPSSLKST
jgi:exonuclease SbcD